MVSIEKVFTQVLRNQIRMLRVLVRSGRDGLEVNDIIEETNELIMEIERDG